MSNSGFSADSLQRARAFASSPADAAAEEVSSLPEPLALAVLEAAVAARALPLVEALAESPHKPLAKAGKKALYRLRSQGVAVPERAASSPAPATHASTEPAKAHENEEALPSLVSSITGNGERALIIGRVLRGGRVETLQCVIADELGLVHLGVNTVSRGQYRRMLRDARTGQQNATAVELPLDAAKALVAEAVGQNLRTRTPFPEGLETALRHLDVSPDEAPRELPPPEADDQGLAARGSQLHAEPELSQWLPGIDALRAFALKVQEIAASPLYLDEAQRVEALRRAVNEHAEAYFAGPAAQLYARRLWHMADHFDRSGRAETALIARAEARRLFHRAEGLFSPFATALFEKILTLSAGGVTPPGLRGPDADASAADEAAADTGSHAARSEDAAAGETAPGERRSPGGLILP